MPVLHDSTEDYTSESEVEASESGDRVTGAIVSSDDETSESVNESVKGAVESDFCFFFFEVCFVRSG